MNVELEILLHFHEMIKLMPGYNVWIPEVDPLLVDLFREGKISIRWDPKKKLIVIEAVKHKK